MRLFMTSEHHTCGAFATWPLQRTRRLRDQTFRRKQTLLTARARRSRLELRLSPVSAFALIHSRAFSNSRNWQAQCESAPLPDFALDAHAPAVRRDDVFDQTQPQSVAANLRRLRLFAAIERLEDEILLGRRDAQPAIRNSDLDLFGVGRLYQFGAQPDPAAVTPVFHCVTEQVLNRAA